MKAKECCTCDCLFALGSHMVKIMSSFEFNPPRSACPRIPSINVNIHTMCVHNRHALCHDDIANNNACFKVKVGFTLAHQTRFERVLVAHETVSVICL